MKSTTDTTRKRRNSLILALTSFIWGISFVAQSEGGDAIGPYSFNCVRSIIGSLFLILIISITDRFGITKKPEDKKAQRTLLTGGVLCGIVLCIATNLQQMGIYLGTASGKAGFLTACYILLVPILGLFFKKKCGINVWIAVAISLVGLYLLCIDGAFRLQFSDTLVMLCALCFSIHILVIDHFSPMVDGLRMSCIQFMITGLLTAIPMFMTEFKSGVQVWFSAFCTWDAWIPLLYAGIFSCGIAYTLQIIGQKGVNPTIASLIMSLESVFSVLAGWVILHEKLSAKELTGCVLIFGAVILSQLPAGTTMKR
ncbi:MAG: DMT family transporter [Wujia sp.]